MSFQENFDPSYQVSSDNHEIQLSLCMIVRDNATIIEPCLSSIKPWVDEMIVVDTGSKDNTPQIAENMGARVFHFPWCDDFSAARNESIKHARGKWVFWMDSDDTIDADNGRKLRELVRKSHSPNILAHVVQVHCPGGPDAPNDQTVVDHVKVFLNRPDLRFEGRIHEQILLPVRRLGGEVGWTDIFVTHSAADHTKSGKQGKYIRDLRCLMLDLTDRPDHPFVLFNLGMTYSDMEDHDEALKWLDRCLIVSDVGESHYRKALALRVHTLNQLDRNQDALDECRRAVDLFPEDPELRFRLGIVSNGCHRNDEAIEAYRLALEPPVGERVFTSVDPSVAGYKARFNLALVYLDTNQLDLAELQLRLTVEMSPHFAQAWRKLGETLIQQSRINSARVLIEQMALQPVLTNDRRLLEGMLEVLCEGYDKAWSDFDRGTSGHPQAADVWQSLSRFLFDHGRPTDAERALRRLSELTPEDGSCLHNLGLVYRMMEQPEKALDCFERSLAARPGATQTTQSIAEVRRQLAEQSQLVPATV